MTCNTPTGNTPSTTTLLGAAEIQTCQLCGDSRSTLKFADGPFRVLCCDGCGLVYVTPRLQGMALEAIYDAGYWKSDNPKIRGYADYARAGELYLKTFRRRMRLVNRHVPKPARVLDVGCAAGFFLRVAQRAGHDVFGVELSAAIAKDAVEAIGADKIHIGTLEQATVALDLQAGSFDLITLWDVIEHIPDPQAILRRVRTLLKPGGQLLLETQNVQSLWARLLGRRWHHYKHHEHLYHFSPSTIRRLLADCGFTTKELTAAYAGKFVSFAFIAERAGRLGRITGLLASPLKLFAGCNLYVNPRDEMIVVAKPV
ncbi:SAM-dependent methyltransferase [Planctomycetota bacterium]|jgi:SAM-dependent methyltransferase|nr:class I SAM-dependent methyltransferase [Planctomycetota bacterium]MSR37461.1 class I SAM-dependent methyltransferase [Planctomycetota bacterium]GDY02831.1 SAM-dependent methyltransferase [Planctomycetota bacterium]